MTASGEIGGVVFVPKHAALQRAEGAAQPSAREAEAVPLDAAKVADCVLCDAWLPTSPPLIQVFDRL